MSTLSFSVEISFTTTNPVVAPCTLLWLFFENTAGDPGHALCKSFRIQAPCWLVSALPQSTIWIQTLMYFSSNLLVLIFVYQVSIPIFTIHGNHDDPTGDGRCSAVDVLAISGLVNYFGKVGNVDDITISPVLLQKGSTRLAIYGMGNVRDERLNRTFRRYILPVCLMPRKQTKCKNHAPRGGG